MEEVIAAAGQLGYPQPDGLVSDQIAATRTMAAYRPSSMIDFVEGREVETEAIWGEPLRRALAAGADMPRLTMLSALIRSLVAQRRAAL
jgi:2-dehydropantoate 2-reductase